MDGSAHPKAAQPEAEAQAEAEEAQAEEVSMGGLGILAPSHHCSESLQRGQFLEERLAGPVAAPADCERTSGC